MEAVCDIPSPKIILGVRLYVGLLPQNVGVGDRESVITNEMDPVATLPSHRARFCLLFEQ